MGRLPAERLLWLCVLQSGVNASLAGVMLVFCLPLGESFERLEHLLRPWVLFFVVPVFAFANSGLDLGGLSVAMVSDPIVLGIVAQAARLLRRSWRG